MKMIVNKPIRYCPYCGFEFRWDKWSKEDFFAGASFSCFDCKSTFQYIHEDVMEKQLFPHLDELFFDGTYSGKHEREKELFTA